MSFLKKVVNLFSKNESQIKPRILAPKHNEEFPPSAEKFELNQIINDGGLTIEEILMLSIHDEIDPSKDTFPGYWNYSYNVDPRVIFTRLLEKGYYIKEKSLPTTLQRKTVGELKDILRKYNLKVSGKKKELINRILNELNEEDQKSIDLIEVYKRNDSKAKEVIENNEHIPFFHRNSTEISIYEAHDFKNKNPNLSPIEIARELLELKARKYISNGDWGLYRNTRVYLAELEMKEKNLEIALILLFEVCYLDLSGMGNNFNPEFMHIYEKHFFPYEKSLEKLAPGIVNYIRELKVKLNHTDDTLKQFYLKTLENYQVPFHLFKKNECAEILLAEINHDMERLKKIYKIAEKRYYAKK